MRVGVGAGPFYVSERVTGRNAQGCGAGCLTLLLVPVALAVLFWPAMVAGTHGVNGGAPLAYCVPWWAVLGTGLLVYRRRRKTRALNGRHHAPK